MKETIFLKLGGSIITDKDKAHTARIDQIDRIGAQIKRFVDETPDKRLLIGHGSGSFGHIAAKKYGTRNGVNSAEDWRGFLEVWHEAHALDEIILDRFTRIGLPVLSFPLSSAAVTRDSQVQTWATWPILQALENGLLPIIFGDVVLDSLKGGTLLSTEEQMAYLVSLLSPSRILLAGLEAGVWEDYPACTHLVEKITPANYTAIQAHVFGSASTDVTGGMASKVAEMMSLIQQHPQLEVRIFSGKAENTVYKALAGESIGTVLTHL